MPDTAVEPDPRSSPLDHVTVADAMHPGIVSCETDARPADVARMMVAQQVHCVAVMHAAHDDAGEPYVWGIISDLDLMRAGVTPSEQERAGALAQQPTITVKPAMALRDAAELMLRHRVSHLVVTDPQTHRPVGVLSTLDVAGVLAGSED